MANVTLLDDIVANLTQYATLSWADHCVLQLNESDFDWAHGLVDGEGKAIDALTPDTWGVSVGTCYQYCASIPTVCGLVMHGFRVLVTVTNIS